MQKLTLGQGFTIQQNIKDDAMRSTIYLTGLVLVFIASVLIFCNNNIIRYAFMIISFLVIVSAYYINIYLARNDTDRLHTESYLINKKIVEAGLLEDKTILQIKHNQQELLTSDLLISDSEDKENE